jgi:hypothetical protein
MRNRLMSLTTALVMAGALGVSAQAPQNPPQNPPPDRQKPATDIPQRTPAASDQAITISGCLKEEKDVAGLKPNVAERAGVTEDYILTNVKMASGSAVSGIALAGAYEIEGLAEAELKKHLNHQVELTGIITQAMPAGNDATPDFRATSMKMIAATCPAAK